MPEVELACQEAVLVRDLLKLANPAHLPLLCKLCCLATLNLLDLKLGVSPAIKVGYGIRFALVERFEDCVTDRKLLPAPPFLIVSVCMLLPFSCHDVLLRRLVGKEKVTRVNRHSFGLVKIGILYVLQRHVSC